jgi:hypothetical protein
LNADHGIEMRQARGARATVKAAPQSDLLKRIIHTREDINKAQSVTRRRRSAEYGADAPDVAAIRSNGRPS